MFIIRPDSHHQHKRNKLYHVQPARGVHTYIHDVENVTQNGLQGPEDTLGWLKDEPRLLMNTAYDSKAIQNVGERYGRAVDEKLLLLNLFIVRRARGILLLSHCGTITGVAEFMLRKWQGAT